MRQKKSKIWKEPIIRIDNNLRIDDNCPFLVKKMEDAIEFLKKAPLPEWVLNRELHTKEPVTSTIAPAKKAKRRSIKLPQKRT